MWRAAGLWQIIEPLLHRFDDASDIIFQVLQIVTAAQIELFVTILWSIWKSRNLKLWQQEDENNNNIIERAKHLLEGWRIVNMKQHGLQQHDSTAAATNTSAAQSGHRGNDVIRWQKPRRGRMKCNVDASFSASRNQFGIEMCIRDDEGQFVLAKTMWFALMCSVDAGEALGLYHAMRWISDLYYQMLILKLI